MIVHTSAKVGPAGFLKTLCRNAEGFFMRPSLADLESQLTSVRRHHFDLAQSPLRQPFFTSDHPSVIVAGINPRQHPSLTN